MKIKVFIEGSFGSNQNVKFEIELDKMEELEVFTKILQGIKEAVKDG